MSHDPTSGDRDQELSPSTPEASPRSRPRSEFLARSRHVPDSSVPGRLPGLGPSLRVRVFQHHKHRDQRAVPVASCLRGGVVRDELEICKREGERFTEVRELVERERACFDAQNPRLEARLPGVAGGQEGRMLLMAAFGPPLGLGLPGGPSSYGHLTGVGENHATQREAASHDRGIHRGTVTRAVA